MKAACREAKTLKELKGMEMVRNCLQIMKEMSKTHPEVGQKLKKEMLGIVQHFFPPPAKTAPNNSLQPIPSSSTSSSSSPSSSAEEAGQVDKNEVVDKNQDQGTQGDQEETNKPHPEETKETNKEEEETKKRKTNLPPPIYQGPWKKQKHKQQEIDDWNVELDSEMVAVRGSQKQKELEEMLAEVGLPTSGNKTELAKRLVKFWHSPNAQYIHLDMQKQRAMSS